MGTSTAFTETAIVGRFQDHLRFAGRQPRTLEELLIARADCEHSRRLAEIKSLRTKLQALDQFMPQIAAAGVRLSYRDIGTHDGGKTLRILSEILGPRTRDLTLHGILLGLGFKEIERKTYSCGDDTVLMKHGRALVISIDLPRLPTVDAAKTAPSAEVAA